MPGRTRTLILFSIAPWIALAGSLAIAVYGSVATHIFAQQFWEPWGWRHFERFVLYYIAGSAVVIAIRPALLPRIMLAAAVTYAVLGVGAIPFLAVIAFLFCCYVLGSFVTEGGRAVMTGLGAYILVLFFLVRWPINYPAVYIALLALPLLLARKRAAACARKCYAAVTRFSTSNRAQATAFAIAAIVLSTHLVVALKPDVSADGLAMHLAIPADVAYHRQYTFRPDQVLWAVMPMGGDWAYTFVYVLGGEFAAKLLNFAMLLVVAGLGFRIVRERSTATVACLVTALFASMPFVQLVTGSLFIENTLAAFCMASLAELWRFRETGERNAALTAAFLLGSAVAVKFGATAFVAAELAAGIVWARRRFAALPRPALTGVAMFSLFIAPACLPYVNAWRLTGNPVYPFLNQRIPSPLLERDVSFEDQRLRQPLRWRTPYDVTFHTSRFSEAQDGSAGFIILALLPATTLALLLAWNRDAVALSSLAVFAIYSVLVFKSTPNFRYLYPVLPLACVAIGAALGAAKGRSGALRYALACAVAAVTAVQFCIMPSSGWYQKDFYVRKLFHRDDAAFLREHAPVRALVAWLNENAPDQPVLFVRDDQIAGLHGLAYSTVWHHYPFLRLLYDCRTAEDVQRMTERLGIRWFIGPFDMDNFSPPLNEFLARDTVKRVVLGNYYVSEARRPGAKLHVRPQLQNQLPPNGVIRSSANNKAFPPASAPSTPPA